jgi:hypothetical protein
VLKEVGRPAYRTVALALNMNVKAVILKVRLRKI